MSTQIMGAPPPRRPVSQHIMDKIANAQSSAPRRPNIRDGRYLTEVRNLLSEDKRKGHCFIIELGIVTAAPSDDPERRTIEPNPPGSLVGNVISFAGGGAEAAPGNVKRFILGLLGVEEEKMTDPDDGHLLTVQERVATIGATYADLVSDAQPARGMLLRATTFCSVIRTGPNQGKLFVGVNWDFEPGQTAASIAARRALIDQGVVGAPVTGRAVL